MLQLLVSSKMSSALRNVLLSGFSAAPIAAYGYGSPYAAYGHGTVAAPIIKAAYPSYGAPYASYHH